MEPALCNAVLNAGNFLACTSLPRETVAKIYHTKEYRAKEAKAGKNTEADAAWRMMGVVGGAGAVGLYVASKNAKGTDKKLVNGAIAAQSIGAAAIFAGHPCMNNDVKPELKNLNLIANLGLGAYALKKALE